MKMIFVLILSLELFASFAPAQSLITPGILPWPELSERIHSELPSCDQAIYANFEYFAASTNEGGRGRSVRVSRLHHPDQVGVFQAPARVVDVKVVMDTLYVLTAKTFEAWDIPTQTRRFMYLTHPDLTRSSSWREAASGFILDQERAIISHGVKGLSVIDLKTGKYLKFIEMPTISSATDITRMDQNQALIAVDNDAEGTFRGIYVFDLQALVITKQIAIDNAFSSSIRVLSGNRLMLGFFNAIWKFDLSTVLQSSGEPKPSRRAWKFPGLYAVDIIGKVHFDEKNIYACFNVLDEATGLKHPQALSFDLATLKLD